MAEARIIDGKSIAYRLRERVAAAAAALREQDGVSAGVAAGLGPCTPQGVLLLLRSANTPLAGAEAVVLGRSAIVGRPVAALLLAADCTVTIVHSKSRDLPGVCRRADIVVAGIGRPQMVKGD